MWNDDDYGDNVGDDDDDLLLCRSKLMFNYQMIYQSKINGWSFRAVLTY